MPLANLPLTNYNGRMKENLFHPSSHMDDREKRFTALFETYADDLFRHAALRISDRDRALELVQEAFLRSLKYSDRGETIENPRSFLYRILNNMIVDEYRKRKTQSLDALLERDETAAGAEGEHLTDPTDILEEAITRFDSARAVEALKQLPDPYRFVLVCRYIDGLSLTEIAESTGENENAISVRIHRALKKLRTILEKSHE
jgi:RNA polymerase sigma-70 factor (ECF subfamily)